MDDAINSLCPHCQQSRSLPVVTVGDDVTDKYRDKLLDSIHDLSVEIEDMIDGKIALAAMKASKGMEDVLLDELNPDRRKNPRGDVARGLVDAALAGGDVQEID